MDRLRQINHLLAEFVRVFWHPLRNNLYRGAKNSCQHYQPGQPDHHQANIYVMIKTVPHWHFHPWELPTARDIHLA